MEIATSILNLFRIIRLLIFFRYQILRKDMIINTYRFDFLSIFNLNVFFIVKFTSLFEAILSQKIKQIFI
jgi:hypothetical protein